MGLDYYAPRPTKFGPRTLAELYQAWEDCMECGDDEGAAEVSREIERAERELDPTDVKGFNAAFDDLFRKHGVRIAY